ncbi:ferredoxin [Sciscionella sediminilitoris]|uniref:ferredoxin n=1 Tax=Sciscionella sediminilitoris TaxID=1445613 RepID=UPI0004DF95F6|nr:ferredoxin [Sciscionella sp. SE31]
MPYVIGSSCIDTKDRACVEECPVDCIYEGDRKLYINPVECIDCGACEPACPMEAIHLADHTNGDEFGQDNKEFFTEILPGRSAPLGNPGGAAAIGPIGVDTLLVRSEQ